MKFVIDIKSLIVVFIVGQGPAIILFMSRLLFQSNLYNTFYAIYVKKNIKHRYELITLLIPFFEQNFDKQGIAKSSYIISKRLLKFCFIKYRNDQINIIDNI